MVRGGFPYSRLIFVCFLHRHCSTACGASHKYEVWLHSYKTCHSWFSGRFDCPDLRILMKCQYQPKEWHGGLCTNGNETKSAFFGIIMSYVSYLGFSIALSAL